MKFFRNNSKGRVGFLKPQDFDLIKDHYLKKTAALRRNSNLDNGIYENAKEAYYLQYFIDDMTFFEYPEITIALEDALSKKFGNPKILADIAKNGIKRILETTEGEKKIGENTYFIKGGKAYYQSIFGHWSEVVSDQIFLLMPGLIKRVESSDFCNSAVPDYSKVVFEEWKKIEGSTLYDPLYIEGETTPGKYFESSMAEIKNILIKPVAFQTLFSELNDELRFEKIFKVAVELVKFVRGIRTSGASLVYLLRDGLMFAEAQKALDFELGEETLSAQVMISRKLLSREPGDEYYWSLSTDALYAALAKSRGGFTNFYQGYCKEINRIGRADPNFRRLLEKIGEYISVQAAHLKGSKKLLIVDTGLQGSINMLTKYIIDHHTDLSVPTDIRMFVAGDWLKRVYAGKYASEYYPMMRDIEIFNRSENLYNYMPGSFEQGELKVTMGSKEDQRAAYIELIIITMICKLMAGAKNE